MQFSKGLLPPGRHTRKVSTPAAAAEQSAWLSSFCINYRKGHGRLRACAGPLGALAQAFLLGTWLRHVILVKSPCALQLFPPHFPDAARAGGRGARAVVLFLKCLRLPEWRSASPSVTWRQRAQAKGVLPTAGSSPHTVLGPLLLLFSLPASLAISYHSLCTTLTASPGQFHS